MEADEGNHSMADDFLDEIVPEEFDWRPIVRRYPIPALVVATVGGFLLGSQRGRVIVAGLSGFAVDAVSEGVNEFLGKEVI